MNRNILPEPPGGGEPEPAAGRKVVAVVGIDRYRHWPRLHNAVSDARGARELFLRLGFEEIVPPLLDDLATGAAIRQLVTDDLSNLGPRDSLVVFFAGHGHTQVSAFENSQPVKSGYIVPVDGDRPGGLVASWLRIDSWLSDVARLPIRHILVILDACYSGVALGALLRWRGKDAAPAGSLDSLRRRRSRRVITSALDDQQALDNGPLEGHSLFTGCLIEGLTSGLARRGRTVATSSEIALYIQERVTTYPGSTQTPDFGTLELDDRGELVIDLAEASSRPAPELGGDAPASHEPNAAAPASTPPLGPETAPAEPIGLSGEPRRIEQIYRRWTLGTVGSAFLVLAVLAASIYAVVDLATSTHAQRPDAPERTGAADVIPGATGADPLPDRSLQDPSATLLTAVTQPDPRAAPAIDAGSHRGSRPPPERRTERPLAPPEPPPPQHAPDTAPPRRDIAALTAQQQTAAPPPHEPSAAAPGSGSASLLLDPTPLFEQAERKLQTNEPDKALDILDSYTHTASAYRRTAVDSNTANYIKAMAHCQLRNIEAAEMLYKHLAPSSRSNLSAFCHKFGIELTAD